MLSNSLNFHKLVRFQNDGAPAGGAPASETSADPADAPATPETPAVKTTFTQDDVNLIMGKTRKEEREKAQKEVEAKFNSERAKEKANLEKAQLEQQGKFKELHQKAEADKVAAEAKAKAAEEETRRLKLEVEFDRKVSANKLLFVNEQAREDAFKALDLTIIGEDIPADMDKAVQELNKTRSYYFGEIEAVETDGAKRGKRPSQEQVTKERVKELEQRFPALKRKPT